MQSNKPNFVLQYFALLLFIVVLPSCGSDSTGSQSETFVQPKKGSSFIFDVYPTDTIFNKPILNSVHDTSVIIFDQTGKSILGKTNVSIIVNPWDIKDTSWVNYEENNDISIYSKAEGWLTMPIYNKNADTNILVVDSQIINGVASYQKTIVTSSFVGNETMEIRYKSFNTIKIKVSIITTITSSGVSNTSSFDSYYYFAPALGCKVKKEIPFTTSSGRKYNGQVTKLIDYTLH